MRAKLLTDGDSKSFVLVFDPGDEVVSGLLAFAKEKSLQAAHFTAIGAFSDVVVAFFDLATKEYRKIPIREQVEVLSLVGNVALHQGEPKVHAHVVVGKADATALGGHLMEAHVQPTLEVILTQSANNLQRSIDEKTGLPLLDIVE
jgi:predicted DNA-binding protein with PD1-like motif